MICIKTFDFRSNNPLDPEPDPEKTMEQKEHELDIMLDKLKRPKKAKIVKINLFRFIFSRIEI